MAGLAQSLCVLLGSAFGEAQNLVQEFGTPG